MAATSLFLQTLQSSGGGFSAATGEAEVPADGLVRLREDLPELSLFRGAVGVVRSTWFSPDVAYEVEFDQPAMRCPQRVLLLHGQIEVVQGPAAMACEEVVACRSAR